MGLAIILLALGEIALAITVNNISDRQLGVIKVLIAHCEEIIKLKKQQEKERGKDERE